ncbi:hypothetical protein SUDANB96_03593 [Streptomyces sp. enrichment culture]
METVPCGRFTRHRLKPEVDESLTGRFASLAQLARLTAEADLRRSCP